MVMVQAIVALVAVVMCYAVADIVFGGRGLDPRGEWFAGGLIFCTSLALWAWAGVRVVALFIASSALLPAPATAVRTRQEGAPGTPGWVL